MRRQARILLSGATGYIGGRLLRRLRDESFHVRCLVRRPEALRYLEGSGIDVFRGDVLRPESLAGCFDNIDTAYYLIHSMGSSSGFVLQDREGASHFGEAAAGAGVKRIIYLGGLADPKANLSEHLRSRIEVGEILRQSGVQVIEFRASIILGSGSLSFELIRSLVERLPVMITPRWVRVEAQPIAVDDVLDYLTEAVRLPQKGHRIYEIGGKDRLSYGGIMKVYASQRGLKRVVIPVPVLTPKLSSYWLGLVTPLYARIGRKLIDGVRSPTVVSNTAVLDDFKVRPQSVDEAIRLALCNEEMTFAETRWSDALASSGKAPRDWGGVRFGNRIVDTRYIMVPVGPERAFRPIRRIGGKTGWYFANGLWKFRGFLDLLIGGVGMRRGRRDPEEVRVGDALDFWRVVAYEPGKRLRLEAEMKLPGRAWLEFEVKTAGMESEIHQTAIFDPVGLLGLLYWIVLYPLHAVIFKGMMKKIARVAEKTGAERTVE